jgi:hypothetical protein
MDKRTRLARSAGRDLETHTYGNACHARTCPEIFFESPSKHPPQNFLDLVRSANLFHATGKLSTGHPPYLKRGGSVQWPSAFPCPVAVQWL